MASAYAFQPGITRVRFSLHAQKKWIKHEGNKNGSNKAIEFVG